MRIVFSHAKVMILDLLRTPAYVVSTMAFPALFYVIFAVPESKDVHSSNLLVASFSCFAVFGVYFLQFWSGIAQERSHSWYQYLKVLPLSTVQLLMARFLSSFFFSLITCLFLFSISLVTTPVELTFFNWVSFFGFSSSGELLLV